MRRKRTSPVGLLLAVAGGILSAGAAGAQVTFPGVLDRAVGMRTTLGPGAPVKYERGRWSVEVGDAELFGIAGLHVVGARSVVAIGAEVLGVELAQIASPVGGHTRAVVEAGYVRAGAWQGGVRAGVERVALRDVEPDRSWLGGAFSRADVGPISLVADVEVVAGAIARATTVSAAAIGRAGELATVVATARFDGSRTVGAGVAMIARLHARLCVIAGYDDGTDTSRVAACIGVGSVDVATGVTHHAVLGMSHAVSVAWTR